MSNSSDVLPLLHNGDAYELTLSDANCVSLLRIVRYADNQNVSGTELRFFDLDPETRQAVLNQIRRRYEGKTIKV